MSRLMHARPSPAMVIAFIALLVAGGGAAVAAIPDSDDKEIHGCYGNRTGALRVIDAELGETCTSKETALVWNQQGPPGDPGAPGTPGSAGASALTGRVTGSTLGQSTTAAAPNGTSAFDTDEGDVEHLSPNSAIVARDLTVRAHLSNSAFATDNVVFSLVSRSAENDPTAPGTVAISCTIAAPSQADHDMTCNTGSATATIGPARELVLRIHSSSTAVEDLRFGWRATTP